MLMLITANGQPPNSDNEGSLNRKSGVFVLYYGNNKLIENCSLYTCSFDSNTSEDVIAAKIESGISAVDPYIGYKFMGGYDCSGATAYLRKQGIGEFNISSCLSISFNSKGEVENDHSGMSSYHYWDNPDNVTETRVMQLDTYGWALVNRVLSKRMLELESDGWELLYTEYNLAGGSNSLYLGKAFSFSPDFSYKAIATVLDSDYYLKLLNYDILDADGYPDEVQLVKGTTDKLSETVTFYPQWPITKIIAAAVSNDKVNTTSAGIIVYRKKYSLQDEFQKILDDGKNDFTSFKLDETKDPNGVVVFKATKVLRLKRQIIYQGDSKQWTYSQFIDLDKPYAPILEAEILKVLAALEKTGNYETQSGDYKGEMFDRLLDKNQKIVFQMVKGAKTISFNFFGNSI